jgi:hypothetical protein
MGLFNTYGGVQLKINRDMNSYEIGERVDLNDGIYVGREGVIVVTNRQLTAMFPTMVNKYGEELNLRKVIGCVKD